MRPLADELRPDSLDNFVGQNHILKVNGLLRRLIENKAETNMVFYGPSGTGKTTLANIIAKNTEKRLYHINATTSSISDIKNIINELDTLMTQNGVLLYLDEIQYFNKKQQQSLLEFLENGKITLIASTTENPYFYVYNALLSRCSIFEFKPVDSIDIKKAIKRAIRYLERKYDKKISCDESIIDWISLNCGGDVRKAINSVDLLFQSSSNDKYLIEFSMEDALQSTQCSTQRYDREGDEHYDLLSALQKSIRGSDPDATAYYLARLLAVGDLISPCRRLLVIASEDIGLAYPTAIQITKSCVDAAMQLGLPEARIPLAEAAILLATSPKSNSAITAIDAALDDVNKGMVGSVPRHLENVHADSTGSVEVPVYKYPHNYKNHYIKQQYLPDNLAGARYYQYGDNKTEQIAKRYWDEIKR